MGACLPSWGAILTLIAFLIGFATYVLPYWFEHFEIKQVGNERVFGRKVAMMGFWANCDLGRGNRSVPATDIELKYCQWFFQDNFARENDLPAWMKACQGVYGFGLMFEFFMLILMNLRPWCCNKNSGISILIGFIMLLVFVCKVVTMVLFGKHDEVGGYPAQYVVPGASWKMGWCPYVSIVGAAMSLLASSAYFAYGCKGNKKHVYVDDE